MTTETRTEVPHRRTYGFEDEYLLEGDFVPFVEAAEMTRRLIARLGLDPVEVVHAPPPDEDGVLDEHAAGWWDETTRTVGYQTVRDYGVLTSTVLHEVAHVIDSDLYGFTLDAHGPRFVGLLIGMHRDDCPGWYDEVMGTEDDPVIASAEYDLLPPFVPTDLEAFVRDALRPARQVEAGYCAPVGHTVYTDGDAGFGCECGEVVYSVGTTDHYGQPLPDGFYPTRMVLTRSADRATVRSTSTGLQS